MDNREMRALARELERHYEDMHNTWHRYLRWYHGAQTDGVVLDAANVRDWAPVNLIMSMIEQSVPVVADAAPIWYVVADDEAYMEGARVLSDVLQALWRSQHLVCEYKQALRDEFLLGTGFMRVWWNAAAGPKDYRGRPVGDVEVRWLDPFTVYIDPSVGRIDDADYLFIAHDVTADRAKRMWPEFEEQRAEQLDVDRQRGFIRRAWDIIRGLSGVQGQRPDVRPLYRVWECYHEAGARLTIFSGSQVLYEGENPQPSGQYPIVNFPLYPMGYSLWGVSMASQIEGLQRRINILNMTLHQHIRLQANAPFFTNDNAVAQSIASVGSVPGVVYQGGRPDATLLRVPPPDLPSWVYMYWREMYEDVKTVTGVQDVLRGLRPGSVQSGIGIQHLQESALVRMRSTTIDNSLQLEKLGQLVLDLVLERYGEPRTLSYASSGGVVQVSYRPEAVMGALETERGTMYYRPRYTVKVEQENSLPLNPMAEAELALRLFTLRDENGLPVIDTEALLEAVKFRRRGDVLRRRAEKMNALMQQAAMQQMMAAGGGAGVGAQEQNMPMSEEEAAALGGALPAEQMPSGLAGLSELIAQEQI